MASFIIPHAGSEVPTLDAVQAHCRGRVASFKIPRQVFVVESFPMTPSGKVQKGKLRDAAEQVYRLRNGAAAAHATLQLELE